MTLEPNKPTPTKKKTRKRKKLNMVRFLVVIFVVTCLVFVGCVAGVVMASMKDVPAWNPKALEPSLPTVICDNAGNEITKIYIENREPVKIQQVPEVVKDAFLAIEDVRFYDHKGIDLRRIAGAAIADLKEGRAAQGASTITQQLVKKAFLSPEKAIKRKIQEAVLAIKLEREYTKDEIFEMYLNQIYFGHGAYGIQSAARIYFGKDVKSLNVEEAAMLAGLPQAPSAYDPYRNPERAKKRRNIVLDSMAKYDFINATTAEQKQQQDIVLKPAPEKKNATYPYPYFVDYVSDQLFKKYGENRVFKGGLKVYTTLDPKIQTIAEKAVANSKNYPKSKADKKGLLQPQAAVVVLDPHTGFIKAIVGGRDHSQKLQFNRATDAKRQPGSSFKPIIAYAPAIEEGHGAGSVVVDEPVKYGKWAPENSDGKFRGPITLREAITSSVNVVAIKLLQETGITKAVNFAKRLGITSLTEGDNNLAIALGGLQYGVTPLELASAYGALDNNGVYVEPLAITKVEDRYGKVIDEFKPKRKAAMKQSTAFIVTDMMKSVVRSGTGTRASLGSRPVAGKTGTTNEGKDIWFAGFTSELVGVVWIGHDEPKPMPRIYGGIYPAKMWKEIMSQALKGTEVKEFEKPAGVVRVSICSRSGKRPSSSCPQSEITSDWFPKGKAPGGVCSIHVQVEVCADSGLLPTDNCPNKVMRSFIKRDAAHTNSTLDCYVPTQKCNIHGPGTKVYSLCNDPANAAKKYLANIPGPGQEGGCPSDTIIKEAPKTGQSPPMEHCPLPDHQVKTKSPVTPQDPTSPGTGTTEPPNDTGTTVTPEKPGKPNKPTVPEVTIESVEIGLVASG